MFSNIPSDVTPNPNGQRRHFSRINSNVAVDPGVASNEYNAGEHNYGAQAHKDLIVTRGEGFRKEKQKKKRGSYRGGLIDFKTRSFQFP
jgi:SRP40, C-terminal domain